jgi:hypothetical protein
VNLVLATAAASGNRSSSCRLRALPVRAFPRQQIFCCRRWKLRMIFELLLPTYYLDGDDKQMSKEVAKI